MKNITLTAVLENLQQVLDFLETELEANACPPKVKIQLLVAAEEIFVNIANYAYCPEEGSATVCCEVLRDPLRVTLQFADAGKPYNPLERKDPDVTLGADEREIGGLGIYMVKKSMDAIQYEYKEGKNILTVQKNCG